MIHHTNNIGPYQGHQMIQRVVHSSSSAIYYSKNKYQFICLFMSQESREKKTMK